LILEFLPGDFHLMQDASGVRNERLPGVGERRVAPPLAIRQVLSHLLDGGLRKLGHNAADHAKIRYAEACAPNWPAPVSSKETSNDPVARSKEKQMAVDVAKLKEMKPPPGMPFRMQKLGHIVLNVTDIERSLRFYTEVLGFRVSDIYPETMVPGGMAFLRCNADHHCLALVGSAKAASQRTEMHHAAFEVASLDEVLRARTLEVTRRAHCR
jgi:predicted enzyme related to lactoylglutathione lyase